jgi:hypothetical protein
LFAPASHGHSRRGRATTITPTAERAQRPVLACRPTSSPFPASPRPPTPELLIRELGRMWSRQSVRLIFSDSAGAPKGGPRKRRSMRKVGCREPWQTERSRSYPRPAGAQDPRAGRGCKPMVSHISTSPVERLVASANARRAAPQPGATSSHAFWRSGSRLLARHARRSRRRFAADSSQRKPAIPSTIAKTSPPSAKAPVFAIETTASKLCQNT